MEKISTDLKRGGGCFLDFWQIIASLQIVGILICQLEKKYKVKKLFPRIYSVRGKITLAKLLND